MVSRKLSIFGFISAAALVSGVLIGCGGSSASSSSNLPIVTQTGGVTTDTGTSTTSAPSSGTPQQVQVTTSGGGTVTATVPPGQQAISTTTPLAVVPMNSPFLNGVSFGPKIKRAPTAHPLNISYDQGATWQWTGVNVNSDASFDGNLVLAGPSACYLQAVGPFTILSSSGLIPEQLTVGQFIFGIVVDATGHASIPSKTKMRIPANGGSTTSGNYVNVTYPSPAYATGTGTLRVTWPGVSKVQTKAIIGGLCAFSDPLSDSADQLPSTGVTTVQYLFTLP